MLNPKVVADMVREIDIADPIDWGMLDVDEEQAMALITSSVLEHYEKGILPIEPKQRDYVIVSTLTKVVLKNFVLNLKLLQAAARGTRNV